MSQADETERWTVPVVDLAAVVRQRGQTLIDRITEVMEHPDSRYRLYKAEVAWFDWANCLELYKANTDD